MNYHFLMESDPDCHVVIKDAILPQINEDDFFIQVDSIDPTFKIVEGTKTIEIDGKLVECVTNSIHSYRLWIRRDHKEAINPSDIEQNRRIHKMLESHDPDASTFIKYFEIVEFYQASKKHWTKVLKNQSFKPVAMRLLHQIRHGELPLSERQKKNVVRAKKRKAFFDKCALIEQVLNGATFEDKATILADGRRIEKNLSFVQGLIPNIKKDFPTDNIEILTPNIDEAIKYIKNAKQQGIQKSKRGTGSDFMPKGKQTTPHPFRRER